MSPRALFPRPSRPAWVGWLQRLPALVVASALLGCGGDAGAPTAVPSSVSVEGTWEFSVTLLNNVVECEIQGSHLALQQSGAAMTGASVYSYWGGRSCSPSSLPGAGIWTDETPLPPIAILGVVTGSNVGERVKFTVTDPAGGVWNFDAPAERDSMSGTAVLTQRGVTFSGKFKAFRL